MKRTLLFVAALLFAAGAMAQDIWLGAQFTNTNGGKSIILTKNDSVVKDVLPSEGHCYMPSLIAGDNESVYYLMHWTNGDDCFTDVYKYGISTSSQRIYSSPATSRVFLRDLFYDSANDDIYACGSYTSGGRRSGFITKNDKQIYGLVSTDYEIVLHGICIDESTGDVLTCGQGIFTEYGSYRGVWLENQFLASVDCNACAYDILYSIELDKVFVCGTAWDDDGESYGTLWVVDGNAALLQYLNDFGKGTSCYRMCMDAGYLYVAYEKQGEGTVVVKIGMHDGELNPVCTCPNAYISEGNLVVNNHGVYVTANKESKYFKDGQAVTTPVQGEIRHIAITNPRNPIVYNLPFTEDFEYGTSHWDDWYVYDGDKDNGYIPSYWTRKIGYPDIAAIHEYNASSPQRGELISPAIRIPSGADATLTFRSMIQYPEYFTRSDLYVRLNPDGVVITEDNMNTLQSQVVKEFEPSDFNDENWTEFTFDLSAYAGQIINLDFVYEGVDGHIWYIDDIEITYPSAGVEDAQVGNLALYPNPANDIIRIEGLESNTEVKIYNTLGELVKTVVVGADAEINISELSAGLYVVRCGETSLRFVKE